MKLLKARSAAPVKYIILTHGHGDHTGGVALWKEPGTQVIAQRNQIEFLNYQERLNRFFAIRNSAQFVYPTPPAMAWPGDEGAKQLATIFFDDKYEFTLGRREVSKSFRPPARHPIIFRFGFRSGRRRSRATISTNRSRTCIRCAERSRAWHSITFIRSTKFCRGSRRFCCRATGRSIQRRKGDRDAGEQSIAMRFVTCTTPWCKGMNDGKDVFTLMREIKLPENLNVGEGYGKLTWSIRGIYEG